MALYNPPRSTAVLDVSHLAHGQGLISLVSYYLRWYGHSLKEGV